MLVPLVRRNLPSLAGPIVDVLEEVVVHGAEMKGEADPSPAHVAEVILCDTCGMALLGHSLPRG